MTKRKYEKWKNSDEIDLGTGWQRPLTYNTYGGQLPEVTVEPSKKQRKKLAEKEAWMGKGKKPFKEQLMSGISNLPRNKEEIFNNTLAQFGVFSPTNWIATGASAVDAGLSLIPGYQREYGRVYLPNDPENPRLHGLTGNYVIDEIAGLGLDLGPAVHRPLSKGLQATSRYAKDVSKRFNEVRQPNTDVFSELKNQGLPKSKRMHIEEKRANFFEYSSKDFLNQVSVTGYRDQPSLGINILPFEGASQGAARDVHDFIANILPEYGTMSSFPQARTPSQLGIGDKVRYITTGKINPKNRISGDYSLDIAKQMYGFYLHPEKAMKAGIQSVRSPNVRMTTTNFLAKNQGEITQDLNDLLSRSDYDFNPTDFGSWNPSQVKLWNDKYVRKGYPPINPVTREMQYYVLKKIPKGDGNK